MTSPIITNAPTKAAPANPANPPAKSAGRRVPMALPVLKLTVPDIPGHVLYWFRGDSQRIQQALAAGYTFVERDELVLNGGGLANSYDVDGNSDLGSRVSVPAGGGGDANSQNGRLYLMKIKQELWEEDELLVAAKHEEIAGALRGDKGFSESGMDTSQRYSRGENRNMFTPRRS